MLRVLLLRNLGALTQLYSELEGEKLEENKSKRSEANNQGKGWVQEMTSHSDTGRIQRGKNKKDEEVL